MRSQSNMYTLLYGSLLGLVIAGYALGSAIAQILQLDNRSTSVIVRALVVVLCAVLIYLFGQKKTYIFRELVITQLLIFWIFYIFKVYIDYIYYPDLLVYLGKDIFLLAIGSTLIPMLTFTAWFDHRKADQIFNIAFAVVFLAASLVAVASFRNIDVVFGSGINRLSYDTLNPISVGNVGVSLTIMALHAIIVKKRSLLNSVAYLVAFALGIVLAALASSRGPILSLVASSIFLIFSFYRGGLLRRSFLTILIILAVVFGIMTGLSSRLGFDPLSRFEMLNNIDYDQSSQGRITLYENAFSDFIDSPVWGKHVVVSIEKFYPHNIFLEIFMSTGLIGAFLTIPVFMKGVTSGLWVSSKNSKVAWIPAIFVQYFAGALFSGAIFTNSIFWVFLMAVITLYFSMKCQLKKRLPSTASIPSKLSEVPSRG